VSSYWIASFSFASGCLFTAAIIIRSFVRMADRVSALQGQHSARELLRLITIKLPPPEGQHHSLLLRDDNSEGLDLMLRIDDAGMVVHLDKIGLDSSPKELMFLITKLLGKKGTDLEV